MIWQSCKKSTVLPNDGRCTNESYHSQNMTFRSDINFSNPEAWHLTRHRPYQGLWACHVHHFCQQRHVQKLYFTRWIPHLFKTSSPMLLLCGPFESTSWTLLQFQVSGRVRITMSGNTYQIHSPAGTLLWYGKVARNQSFFLMMADAPMSPTTSKTWPLELLFTSQILKQGC